MALYLDAVFARIDRLTQIHLQYPMGLKCIVKLGTLGNFRCIQDLQLDLLG